ncbi:MAG: CDP-diacylglycerol--glycerol-3-phosphate 3-phosphatidyltransferase [Chthoniobacterales bacterium]
MNFCNLLTILRLLLTIFFVITFFISSTWSSCLAFVIFAFAAFTDWLDGYLARRYELCTNFGRLMDPLADKILVASALICLIPIFPSWVVVIIIAREFLITGLRLLAADQGIILSADGLGKQKTTWQLITILFYLALLTATDFIGVETPAIIFSWNIIGPVLIGITLIITIISGASYVWRNRTLFCE